MFIQESQICLMLLATPPANKVWRSCIRITDWLVDCLQNLWSNLIPQFLTDCNKTWYQSKSSVNVWGIFCHTALAMVCRVMPASLDDDMVLMFVCRQRWAECISPLLGQLQMILVTTLYSVINFKSINNMSTYHFYETGDVLLI